MISDGGISVGGGVISDGAFSVGGGLSLVVGNELSLAGVLCLVLVGVGVRV